MAADSWELIAGRCGACTRFQSDYGSGERTYGHCGVKPRSGSIAVTSFKCDVYVPRAEVAPPPPVPSFNVPRLKVNPFEVTATTPLAGSARPTQTSPVRAGGSPQTSGASGAPVSTRSEARDREPVDNLLEGETMNRAELRLLIQEAIEDSLGIGEVETFDRFKGGTIVIRPAIAGTQDKELPIDALLHKIVMVRDNLRVLEQKINGHEKLDDGDRVALQQYITRCYGSLTTFNMLLKNREDWFKGAAT